VADQHTGNVGDGVQRTGCEYAGCYSKFSRAHAI
jgi:hypothetical protein